MARESRSAGSTVPTTSADTPGQKRKRPSDPDSTTSNGTASLKITLPAAASLQSSSTNPSTNTGLPKVRLTLSPTKANGALPTPGADAAAAGEPEAKKQKISLKLNGAKNAMSATMGGVKADERQEESKEFGEDMVLDGPEETDGDGVEKRVVGTTLSRDVREALSIVIEQMAIGLPAPMNDILTFWLPPTFEQIKTNTLGFALRRTDLTWEELVNLLHILSTNSLAPSAYPTPFPCLADFHLPIPPLASHQPPHGIYNFYASLRDILLSIEPTSTISPGAASGSAVDVRGKVQPAWAMTVRAPTTKGSSAQAVWWSSLADPRAVRESLERLRVAAEKEGKQVEGEGLLEVLAADGGKFGFAQPVSLTSVVDSKNAQAPKLGERVIARASLKARQWKEQLAARPRGFFGSVRRPAVITTAPPDSQLGWTPSFASTFDSNRASGGMGYWDTLDAMHYKARYSGWKQYLKGTSAVQAGQGYTGVLPPRGTTADEGQTAKDAAESGAETSTVEADAMVIDDVTEADAKDGAQSVAVSRTAEEQLDENAVWINELLGWQEMRAFNGVKDVGERENLVAETLQDSLIGILAQKPPSDITALQTGDAHQLAKRFISTSAPLIRGTLDPARPKAVHDNYTVFVKPPPITSTNTPSRAAPAPATPQGGLSMAQQLAGTSNANRHFPQQGSVPRKPPGPPAPNNNMPPAPRYNYTPNPQGQPPQMGNPPRPPMSSMSPAPGGGPYGPPVYGNNAPYRPPGQPQPPNAYGYPNSNAGGMTNPGNGAGSPYGRPMMQPSPSPVNNNVMLPNQGQYSPQPYGPGYPPPPAPQQGMGPWGSQPPQQPPSPSPFGPGPGPGPGSGGAGPGYGYPQPPSPVGGQVNMGMPPMGSPIGQSMGSPMGMSANLGMPGMNMPPGQGQGYPQNPAQGMGYGYGRPGMAPSGLRQSFGPA